MPQMATTSRWWRADRHVLLDDDLMSAIRTIGPAATINGAPQSPTVRLHQKRRRCRTVIGNADSREFGSATVWCRPGRPSVRAVRVLADSWELIARKGAHQYRPAPKTSVRARARRRVPANVLLCTGFSLAVNVALAGPLTLLPATSTLVCMVGREVPGKGKDWGGYDGGWQLANRASHRSNGS